MQDNGQSCPTVAYAPSAEYISDAWEQYRKGQLPDARPLTCTSQHGRFVAGARRQAQRDHLHPVLPDSLDADENRSWKEQYADTCVQIFDKFAPGFADSVTNRSSSPTATSAAPSAHMPATTHMPAATQPTLDRRVVEARTSSPPARRLYLCGQCTHPGRGDRHPGWNGAEAALKHLNARVG